MYEERITLWSAQSIEDSIALAEAEAQVYAIESSVEYLRFCQAYAMYDEVNATSIEVFSLLRESPLEPTEYIRSFFATGTEREGDV